ncbi:MAG: DUF2076 domain-containing protein [Alphaproteobacteria bacterium]|nr:DUF2076 domain-containing protein [Alphaproteobacteria bacterium]
MTNEERDIITRFIERVGGASSASFGSVPGAAPALPPIDREADALIGELFAKYPEARYRLTQTAFVQEHALAEAQNRIKRLEYELQQAQAAAQQAAEQPRAGGFLSGIFGGGASRPPAPPPAWNQGGPQQPQYGQGYAPGGPPPPPQYAPGYQPGMFQRSGSGFLGSALTTAAGVAGGLVVGNALMDMFSPHRAAASELGSGAGFMPAAPVESSPWGAPAGGDAGYVDQGSWTTPDSGTDQGGGYADQGSWDPAGGDQASWDSSGGDDGGWDDNNA